jgi:hypothetical protein
MAIPFPYSGMAPTLEYDTPPFVDPFNNYSSKDAWRQTTPPTDGFFFDQLSLRGHVATVSSDGSTLTVDSMGESFTFDLTSASGDGTGRIPVGVLDNP